MATRNWPGLLAIVAALPVGIAASAPGFSGADLLLIGLGGLFAWGWTR